MTGISGFVGPHLAKELLQKGANVFGLTRSIDTEPILERIQLPQDLLDRLHFLKGDLLDARGLENAVREISPEFIFHLGAQGIPRQSFEIPVESYMVNFVGTLNLLESVRKCEIDPRVVYAGSSHAYGIIILSEAHLDRLQNRYGSILPLPERYPELPVSESSPLRPVSPYGVGKLAGEMACRQYQLTFGIPAMLARSFNHEGIGRTTSFVTAYAASNIAKSSTDGQHSWNMGNISAMLDWSHVEDIVEGYCQLALEGQAGTPYNLGSMRANSILTYVLWGIESLGREINRVSTLDGKVKVTDPLSPIAGRIFGVEFEKTRLDSAIMTGEISFTDRAGGVLIETDRTKYQINIEKHQFSLPDSPVILCDNRKAKQIGFKVTKSVKYIVQEQIAHFKEQQQLRRG